MRSRVNGYTRHNHQRSWAEKELDGHKLFRLEVELEGEILDYERFQEFINAMLDQFDVKLAPTHSVGWDIVSYVKAEIEER